MIQTKKGQGLSTNAIVLIILAVVILVVLIIGFTAGWDSIAPWVNPSNNVDDVVQDCNLACSTQSVYGFCTLPRELKAQDLPGEVKSVENTCEFFSNPENADFQKYGVASCPGLCNQA